MITTPQHGAIITLSAEDKAIQTKLICIPTVEKSQYSI